MDISRERKHDALVCKEKEREKSSNEKAGRLTKIFACGLTYTRKLGLYLCDDSFQITFLAPTVIGLDEALPPLTAGSATRSDSG